MKVPSISIGLPVYNGERYLRVAIDSILDQTFPDFELIISDNGSTDGTDAICRVYAARDPRVRYLPSRSNVGAARNFRRVFNLARAPYFKWIASDDYCAPEFLARCKSVLDASPEIALCTTKVNDVDENGQTIAPYADAQALQQESAMERMIAAGGQDSWCNAVYGLIRSDVLRRTAVMGNYSGSDVVLLAEISLHGKFAEVPERLLFRRHHSAAYSHNVSFEKVKAFYDPSAKRGTALVFRSWRHLLEYFRAVCRAPLAFSERLRLVVFVLRMAWWYRDRLAAEVAAALRNIGRS